MLARATSAAPTYFECSDVKSLTEVSSPLIDGGVFVNNPTLCAFAEVYNEYKTSPDQMAILSLGTGYSKKEYDYNRAKNWGHDPMGKTIDRHYDVGSIGGGRFSAPANIRGHRSGWTVYAYQY